MTAPLVEAEPVALALRAPDALALEAKGQEADRALASLKAMPCETAEQEQAFADFLTMCRGIAEQIDADRRTFTDPLHREKTRIDKLYKPISERWAAVEELIRAKLQSAAQRRLQAQQEAKRLAAEAARAGNVAAAVTALQAAPERAVVSGIGHSECWEVDTANVQPDLVPREWLTIDWSKVKIHLRDHKHSPTIPEVPGIPFKRVATVRAK